VFLTALYFTAVKAKVQQSHTGLNRPLGLQELEAPRISKQSAYESGKVVNPIHQLPVPPTRYLWYSFLLEAESTLGHSAVGRIKSMKNPNGPTGHLI
jgi:hypothetical protein